MTCLPIAARLFKISAVFRMKGFESYNSQLPTGKKDNHEYTLGAATYAAKMGKSYDEIMTMGRWKSESYKRYIRIEKIDTCIYYILSSNKGIFV